MRPYKLGNKWFDLHAIQSICSPIIENSFNISFQMILAFQDKPIIVEFFADTSLHKDNLDRFDLSEIRNKKLDEWKEIHEIRMFIEKAEMEKFIVEQYNPLIQAWINRDAT